MKNKLPLCIPIDIKKIIFYIFIIYQYSISAANIEPIIENPDVIEQNNGLFPELERKHIYSLGAIQHVWDTSKSTDGVYVVYYHPYELIKIRVREYMNSTVVLPIWEKIKSILVGDENVVKVSRYNDYVFSIIPQQFIGADTNVSIIGSSGNIYNFYVRNEGYNSNKIPDLMIYVKSGTHLNVDQMKDNALEKSGNEDNNDYLSKVTYNPKNIRFNYTMIGNRAIAPKQVFSDGYRTWFYYGNEIDRIQLPTIYIVRDKIDVPTNVFRIGESLVANDIGNFTLKNGNKILCVNLSESL